MLYQISITTTLDAEEAVANLMSELFGQLPVAYHEDQSNETVVTVYSEQPYSRIKGLRPGIQAGLRKIKQAGLDSGKVCLKIQRLRQQDWAESWKRHIRPHEIGRALLVKPTWSLKQPRPGQEVVEIDPGLSFGTGQHPTTAFCLRQIVNCRPTQQPKSLLDIGAGTGILAIAAAKLGYKPVCAFDADAVAVRIAKKNASRNRVRRRIRISRCDLRRLAMGNPAQFDVICANLEFDLLMAESGRILKRLRPDGALVVAGILASQFPLLKQAYAQAGLRLVGQELKQSWHSGAFKHVERF